MAGKQYLISSKEFDKMLRFISPLSIQIYRF